MDGLALFRQAMQEDSKETSKSGDTAEVIFRQSSFESRAQFLWCKASYQEHRRRFLTKDPFQGLMWTAPVERALEHCYNLELKRWERKEILVRIDLGKVVGSGAMRECYQMKMTHTNTQQLDWQRLREKPMEMVVPGIGSKTSQWLARALPCTSEHLHIGECLDLMHKEEHLVKSELRRLIHDDNKREEALTRVDRLFTKDKEMKLFWRKLARNVMAKDYKADKVEADDKVAAFKADVVMQEFCKNLSQAYNLFEPPPPKPIDMLHVGMVQLVERSDQPMLAFECFIQGEYKKWNTNAGWLDTRSRHTPQAFSFFTYRFTNGEYIVVDIQGVGNIFTDPQVHCAIEESEEEEEGIEHQFGEGNLGTRGMALFLGTFRYDLNPIVEYMGLAPFAWAPSEKISPDEAEREHYEQGKAYLESQEWDVRRKGFKRSSSTGTDLEHIEQQVAWFLHEAAAEHSLFDIVDVEQIPTETTIESKVHLDLAKLHLEDDPRLVDQRGCSPQDAYYFHLWMAALGGHVKAQISVGEELCKLGREEEALQWYSVASKRSRHACLAAAGMLEAQPECAVELLLEFYSTALSVADGFASDSERLLQMETCDHEIHSKLAKLYAEMMGQDFVEQQIQEQAIKHLERAAEIALEIGKFKLHTKYSNLVESVQNGDGFVV